MNTKALIVTLITVMVLVVVQAGETAVRYVDCNRATNGGGSSWANAYNNIQSGVNASAAYDQLWVKGTCNLSATITVDRAVQIYGGFAGTETALSERTWTQNVTTVSGGNARRCFLVTANNARIDGFTITGGKATDYAGGVHFDIAGYGPFTTTYLYNCRIHGNSGVSGGGVSTMDSHVQIVNCTIYSNTAADGGGVYSYVYAVSIVNSTIYGNSATYHGGGYSSLNVGNPQSVIVNSVFYSNTSSDSTNTLKQIYYSNGCPMVTYTNVYGGWSYAGCGSNNFNLSPGFVNAGAGDFHLTSSSALKDIGNNSPADYQGMYVFYAGATDFEGDARQYGTKIDLGADEYAPDTKAPTGSISIKGGDAYTNSTTVTVTNSITDPSGVSHMCLSEGTCPDYPTSPWETFAGTKGMTLSSGDGTKTVNAWFRDSLGNITPAGSPISDTIILDGTTPIDGTLVTTDGNGETLLNWFGFSDGSGSGIASYKLVSITGETPPADCGGSTLYSGSGTTYTHSSPAGTTNSYRLCATDNAGNASTGATASGTPSDSSAVRLASAPSTPYMSIQTAYANAANPDVIQLRETGFREFLDFNLPIIVTLQGAYDPAFTAVQPDAASDVYGSLTISAGTVTIGEVFIF